MALITVSNSQVIPPPPIENRAQPNPDCHPACNLPSFNGDAAM